MATRSNPTTATTSSLSRAPHRRASSGARLGGLALLLALVGCSGGAPESVGQNDEPIVTATGVDYSFARPTPSGLKKEGYTFAARYLSPPPNGKNLSKSEADALWAAGVDVVVVFEQGAMNALGGKSQGITDATLAESQAASDGMPAHRPIYFAIDFDAQPADMAAIDAYFEGVASVIGVGRTGAYGGDAAIKHLFDGGKIRWGWQTYAWSGGTWDARAQLRQTMNGITAAGDSACCDEDQAQTKDFGQWHVTGEDPCDTADDGEYCGQSTQWTGGTKDHLYHCVGGKTASDVACPAGCIVTSASKPDYCAAADAGAGSDAAHDAIADGAGASDDAGAGDGASGVGADAEANLDGAALDGATNGDGALSVGSTHGAGGCAWSKHGDASSPARGELAVGIAATALLVGARRRRRIAHR
jgi:hypothetical protein